MAVTLDEGRYALGERLGYGGMAEVFAAHDLELQRPVAVKLLHRHLSGDPVAIDCFAAGMRAAAGLVHPGIVPVFDAGWADRGRPFAVMEWVRGRSLAAELAESGRLTEARVADIGRRLCEALQAAHASGVLHCDIKPANALLADDGRVLLADFGPAPLPRVGGRASERGDVLGTPGYMAPEVLGGEAPGAAADVYGLGATLFCALAGEVPVGPAWPQAGRAQAPPALHALVPDVSREMERTLTRALAGDPGERWPSARSFGERLAAIGPEAPTRVLALSSSRVMPRPGVAGPIATRDLAVGGDPTPVRPAVRSPRVRRRRIEKRIAVLALVLGVFGIVPALLSGAGNGSTGSGGAQDHQRRGEVNPSARSAQPTPAPSQETAGTDGDEPVAAPEERVTGVAPAPPRCGPQAVPPGPGGGGPGMNSPQPGPDGPGEAASGDVCGR